MNGDGRGELDANAAWRARHAGEDLRTEMVRRLRAASTFGTVMLWTTAAETVQLIFAGAVLPKFDQPHSESGAFVGLLLLQWTLLSLLVWLSLWAAHGTVVGSLARRAQGAGDHTAPSTRRRRAIMLATAGGVGTIAAALARLPAAFVVVLCWMLVGLAMLGDDALNHVAALPLPALEPAVETMRRRRAAVKRSRASSSGSASCCPHSRSGSPIATAWIRSC